MFKILDGREHFFQWDSNRKLIVEDRTVTQVHFCNKTGACSLVCETYEEDGLWVVNVPNILLQETWRINVYAYDGNYTKHSAFFTISARTKPEGYVYTETEVKRYEDFEKRLEALENGSGSGGGESISIGEVYITRYDGILEDAVDATDSITYKPDFDEGMNDNHRAMSFISWALGSGDCHSYTFYNHYEYWDYFSKTFNLYFHAWNKEGELKIVRLFYEYDENDLSTPKKITAYLCNDIAGGVSKEYVDQAIQTAILDSWESAV